MKVFKFYLIYTFINDNAYAFSSFHYKAFKVPDEYPFHTSATAPFHPNIHGHGNVGKSGEVHASRAALFTKFLDIFVYKGRNIREEVAERIYELSSDKFSDPTTLKVVDIGCSVGMFTECLLKVGFQDVTALDSSSEMLEIAQTRLPENIDIICGNACFDLPKADIYVCGFVLHELPSCARLDIIRQVHKNIDKNGLLVIVDIYGGYIPKPIMLDGEPFVKDYLKNWNDEISNSIYFDSIKTTWLNGHVDTWWCKPCKTTYI